MVLKVARAPGQPLLALILKLLVKVAKLSARGAVAGRFCCWAEAGPRGRGFVCVWLARDNLPVTVEQEVFAREE